ncbi:MAG: hypothetical protein PGN37_12305 [Mycobacterium kyogaense]|uniref:hypothetical protein n=1 Tax=Mycobacterium kyogaense TaxID=2212479 RepID=UPI002FF801A4
MAEMPTWNGQAVTQEDVIKVARSAFEIVLEHMRGTSMPTDSKHELLHLLEAGSYLYWMGTYTTSVALTAARDAGASWNELGAAMGVSRSSAKSRYEREVRDGANA